MPAMRDTTVRSNPSPCALHDDASDSCLGMDVTLRVRATGKAACSYYIVMGCTILSTELDYADAAWRLAVRDRCVTALSRHAYLFELH
jgi:hypothetical protein